MSPSLKPEDKAIRFKRIAERRVRHVLERIRILGNCSNRSFYSWTEADIEKIFRTIEKEVEQTRKRFTRRSSKSFRLDG